MRMVSHKESKGGEEGHTKEKKDVKKKDVLFPLPHQERGPRQIARRWRGKGNSKKISLVLDWGGEGMPRLNHSGGGEKEVQKRPFSYRTARGGKVLTSYGDSFS